MPRFAMLIVCPNCATSHQVEPHSLGQDGRSVRCALCRNVWFATAMSTTAASDEWDVIDTGTRLALADNRAESPAASERASAGFTAPEDIDVAGLSAAMDTVRQTGKEAGLRSVGTELARVGAA